MQLLISYQTALLTECHITYFTVIMVLPTMFAFCLIRLLVTVCLITHITNIMALTTVFAYVYQANLATMSYYTRHT